MGTVYQAEDLRLGRPVALKLISPERTGDEDAKSRFVQEARAASVLDHTNICTIFEVEESPEGELYIVMAYYDGRRRRDPQGRVGKVRTRLGPRVASVGSTTSAVCRASLSWLELALEPDRDFRAEGLLAAFVTIRRAR